MTLCYRLLAFSLFLLIPACSSDGTGVEGRLLFQQHPLAKARVELYLKSGTERSSSPFSVVTTDSKGAFRASLPPGKYFLVGKKKEQGGGVNRMLLAEYPLNPVVIKSGYHTIKSLSLKEVGYEGAIIADGKTRAMGKLQFSGQPLTDAFIYVYTRGDSLTGPAYGLLVQADEQGGFTLNLSTGRYWLAARKRHDGSRVGDPQAGDLNGEYPENPVIMKTGETRQLKPWSLKLVSVKGKEHRMAKGVFARTSTWLSGRVVDEDHAPIAGIYLFAYRDSRMIGKPNFISTATKKDGHFRIYLDKGGDFFVGARSNFGGPLEPGEWVGTLDKRPDHRVVASDKRATELGDIQVREVW